MVNRGILRLWFFGWNQTLNPFVNNRQDPFSMGNITVQVLSLVLSVVHGVCSSCCCCCCCCCCGCGCGCCGCGCCGCGCGCGCGCCCGGGGYCTSSGLYFLFWFVGFSCWFNCIQCPHLQLTLSDPRPLCHLFFVPAGLACIVTQIKCQSPPRFITFILGDTGDCILLNLLNPLTITFPPLVQHSTAYSVGCGSSL